MKRNIVLAFVLAIACQAMAQTPRWIDKAKQATVSVLTYDKSGNLLNTGNGVFISSDGVAISDHTLFKNAQRATVVDCDGKKMEVNLLLGIQDLYDIIKFKVELNGRKVEAFEIQKNTPKVGAPVYVVPYSSRKEKSCSLGKITKVDAIDAQYAYYTTSIGVTEKNVSCPLVDGDGKLLGLVQASQGSEEGVSYASDARLADALKIDAFSSGSTLYTSIGIPTAMPDSEEQALLNLYLQQKDLSPTEYETKLNEFIARFPKSADGYVRRANFRVGQSLEPSSVQQAEADMQKALDVTKNKAETYYDYSNLIYNYVLANPQHKYEKWNLDTALGYIRQANGIKSSPIYQLQEGNILFSKGNYAEALPCFEAVNQTGVRTPVTFYSTARTKEMLQAPHAEILALMDSCMSFFQKPYVPDAAPYLYERARYKMLAGDNRHAILDLNDYYETMGGRVNDGFYYTREQAAFGAKQFQLALDDIAKAIQLNPDEPLYRAEQAVINIRVGRSDEALKILQEAIAKHPDNAELYRLQGLAYVQLKQQSKACDSFDKAKSLGSANVDSLIQKYCQK